MLSCVYDTTIPAIYSFKHRPPPSCPRERAGVLHAAGTAAQDRAARRASPGACAPHHAPAQAGGLTPRRSAHERGTLRSTAVAPAKTALFAGAAACVRHPLRRGLTGEPWV